MLVGVDRVWTVSRWRLGLGVTWIDTRTNLNGTRWEFTGSLGYALTPRSFIEYRHHSHGAKLGIENGVPNGGWNFLGLGLVF